MNSAVFAKYKKQAQERKGDHEDDALTEDDAAAPAQPAGTSAEKWSPVDRAPPPQRVVSGDVPPQLQSSAGNSPHEMTIVPPIQSAAPSASTRQTTANVTPREGPSAASPLFSPIQPARASASDRLSERPHVAEDTMMEVADWDNINVEEERRRVTAAASARHTVQVITFKEAFLAIRADTRSWQRFVTPELKRLADHVETSGFWGTWWSCLHSNIEEGTDDYTDRDFVLALQFVPLEATNDVHRRMMVTLYRRLERPARNAPDPAAFGQHWERLGFQGNDPSTDLRSTGILGVLQLLYLADFYPTFCGALYHSATNPLTEVPFVLVGFNFSGVAMEALKERGLHDDIAARRKKLGSEKHKSSNNHAAGGAASNGTSGSITSDFEYRPPPVMHSLCEFYVGALFVFFTEWRQSTSRQVTDFGPVKAKLRPFVRENVAKVLKHCDTAGDRKKMNDITSNKQSIQFSTASSSGAAKSNDREFMEF